MPKVAEAAPSVEVQHTPSPPARAVLDELERVASSPELMHASVLVRLLRHIVQTTIAGRGAEMKEYTIGLEVFGRGEDFDPREDAVVRVQAHRLRQRLEKHYAANGRGGSVRINLPRGTYQPEFIPLNPDKPRVVHGHRSRFVGVLASAALAAMLLNGTLPPYEKPAGHDDGARRLYEQGDRLRIQNTPDGIRRSIGLFEQSLARDPGNVASAEALAGAWLMAAIHRLGPLAEAEMAARARSAAEAALRIHPESAPARGTLGALAWLYGGDPAGAEKLLREAIRLDPAQVDSRVWLASALLSRSPAEASAECRRAAATSPAGATGLALILYRARRYEEAASEAQRSIRLAGDNPGARVVLGLCALAAQRPQDAVAEFEAASRLAGGDAVVFALPARLGYAYAAAGDGASALDTIARMRNLPPLRQKFSHMAFVYLGLGDQEGAMECLERAAAEHEAELILLAVEPVFDSLRSNPRFQAIVNSLSSRSQ